MAPELRRTATAVVVGALAVVFDTTIVSISLPTLVEELHAPVHVIQWVSTGYLLALGVAIPLVGWLQARLGGRRLWMAALLVFLGASVLCASAWDATSLIVFRVLQGLGGGIMLPLMATLVVQAAGGRNLGRVMATMSLPAVLGRILGPVLGGLILEVADWRWMFLVNVPFCTVGLVLAWRMLPADRPRTSRPPLDVVGLLLLSPAVAGMLVGLSRLAEDGGAGRSEVLLPLLGGVVLLVAFVGWAVRRGEAALVDVRLLRHRALLTSTTLLFLSGVALYGAMLVLPLFWQQARGVDVLGAGLLLAPQGVGTLLSRSVAGGLVDRIGARWVCLGGFAVVAAGTVPFALAGTSGRLPLLLAALVVRGVGLGAVTIPLMSTAYLGLDGHDVAHASVFTRIASQVGGAFGVAVLAVILAGSATPGTTDGFDGAFWWATAFAAAGVPLSVVLPSQRRRGGRPDAVQGSGELGGPEDPRARGVGHAGDPGLVRSVAQPNAQVAGREG
ncbi:multidrug efflux MFS transporter [Phycicoccus endophyticus]|uniref:Multidrug efflux MFS transporter n=2 Tax=Phycicoccus endophyticus TaxID=1690220 RepID=A0A7G9R5H4_9MICO|nr:multidrug efflux MFS transporter [Phycicoccus endophyticus]QNN50849.1 multidrug efflux MFS transporter [Phycicoccus endophyticus]